MTWRLLDTHPPQVSHSTESQQKTHREKPQELESSYLRAKRSIAAAEFEGQFQGFGGLVPLLGREPQGSR